MEEDHKSTISMVEGEDHLIAAAQHILEALGSKKKMTTDMRKILADLGSQLSSMSTTDENITESPDESIIDIEDRLNKAQDKIMSWETDESMIWDCGHEEASEYLNAVEEVREFTETLEKLSVNEGVADNTNLLRRAHDVLQTSMARLEEEFRYMLIQNRQPFEPEHMSFRSSEDETMEEVSSLSFEDDPTGYVLQRGSISKCLVDYTIDLVNRDVILDLKNIANAMFASNYDQECQNAYICVRKDALDECLFILEMEKSSIEDVLKMDLVTLNSKIKRWIRAIKIFIMVYLASEKRLTGQIFGEREQVVSVCFLEASKVSMLQLLNFGEAVAIGPYKPEKLFRILDMYEILSELLPDIDALFSDDPGRPIRTECREVLSRLGDTVRSTILEFENAIASNVSTNAFAAGSIHHLTKYVMNYITTLTDYNDTLNTLLKDHEKDRLEFESPNTSPISEEENSSLSCTMSPMAIRFNSISLLLEANLVDKSKLYRDASLQHFFLMNNIHYMAQKVMNSELRPVFGDGWIRRHNWKFQQHAMNYERATWTNVLSLLGEEDPPQRSNTLLKERFRVFYAAFDEIYKTQTGWLIPDQKLRDDLRISTALNIIQAYQNFVKKHGNNISEKYIKYSAEDLENYLMDLFEGTQRSLQHLHRR